MPWNCAGCHLTTTFKAVVPGKVLEEEKMKQRVPMWDGKSRQDGRCGTSKWFLKTTVYKQADGAAVHKLYSWWHEDGFSAMHKLHAFRMKARGGMLKIENQRKCREIRSRIRIRTNTLWQRVLFLTQWENTSELTKSLQSKPFIKYSCLWQKKMEPLAFLQERPYNRHCVKAIGSNNVSSLVILLIFQPLLKFFSQRSFLVYSVWINDFIH